MRPRKVKSVALSILTFGCGIIIGDEAFPCVVDASEVLDGHRAGGGLVDEVGTGAGLPQGLG